LRQTVWLNVMFLDNIFAPLDRRNIFIGEWLGYTPTLPLKVITQGNFVVDFMQFLNFINKYDKSAFGATLWRSYGQRKHLIYGSV